MKVISSILSILALAKAQTFEHIQVHMDQIRDVSDAKISRSADADAYANICA